MENIHDLLKIKTNDIPPRKGRVLIAEPFLMGEYFYRSVVFLVAHSKKGAVGFILNKKIEMQLSDVFEYFPAFETDVYLGGPVATDSIYYLHKLGDQLEGSIQVLEDLYWGGNFEQLKTQIEAGLVEKSDIRFFLGYSGWDSGQLEDELEGDSWLVNDIDSNEVMKSLSTDDWMEFVKKVDKKYHVWENFPENPNFN